MILLKPISSVLKFVAKTDLMNAAWRRHRSCHHRWFFKFFLCDSTNAKKHFSQEIFFVRFHITLKWKWKKPKR